MKKKIIEELVIIFWLFVLGSIAGYCIEMMISLVEKGHFESRQGMLYGPFTQVYGIGIVLYYAILRNVKTTNLIKIFFITMILGGATEYVMSFIQEEVFGTVSWDYSDMFLNINGRTSLLYGILWGTAGVVYVKFVMPIIDKCREATNDKFIKIITAICALFMLFDITISIAAAERQTERRNNILPSTRLDEFLDRHYPDEFMDKVYSNKKERDVVEQ